MIKSKNRLNLFEPLIITFVWVLLFAAPLLIGQFEDQINWNHVFRTWKGYLPLLLLFFVNRFILLPKLFFRNRRSLYIMSAGSLIVLMTAISFVNHTKSLSSKDRMPHEEEFGPKDAFHKRPLPIPLEGRGRFENPPRPQPIPPYASLLILSILLISFDTGLRVSFRLAETEREKARLEKENVGTQLAFLRNQISPHFFMNTLNNIHALVDFNTEEAKESIIKLSRLMGYLLYETQTEKMPLQKEIQFINSFVELMQLRYSDKVKIELQIPERLPSVTIPPLMFISFVENAFKYGISYQHPSYIHIRFSFEEGLLQFEIENSVHGKHEKVENSGIGIENTRKRLDLIYGSNYELKIDESPQIFKVKLNIPL